MSVVTVTKKIYEQVVALVQHLQPSTEEEALQQEISGFFAVKQRKQRTKSCLELQTIRSFPSTELKSR